MEQMPHASRNNILKQQMSLDTLTHQLEEIVSQLLGVSHSDLVRQGKAAASKSAAAAAAAKRPAEKEKGGKGAKAQAATTRARPSARCSAGRVRRP